MGTIDRASSAQSLSTTPSPASSSPAITSPPSTTAILSSSASSAAAAFPDFLMPEGNTQDCDIFGPYCQTGTINVPLNLTSTTTTTAVDCSYYLSAQSYTNQFITPYGGGPLYAVSPYVKSLGRSPECTAYAVDIEGPSADALYAKCDNSTGQLGPRDDYKPVGVWVRFNAALTYGCCGPCNFEADEIRVLYFPDEEAEAACSAQVGSNGTIIQSATSTQIPMGSTSVNLAIRAVTDVTASTTIYNGVTL